MLEIEINLLKKPSKLMFQGAKNSMNFFAVDQKLYVPKIKN